MQRYLGTCGVHWINHALKDAMECGCVIMISTFHACFFLWLIKLNYSHSQVSSVRASKSDDKRLSIFTGTKTLHLRCISREDRAMWIEALQSAKDLFPRSLTSSDLATSEDIVVSTEKLRSRLSQEGIAEAIIKDCESIMLAEVSYLQDHLKFLHQKHVMLLDTLKQLEVFIFPSKLILKQYIYLVSLNIKDAYQVI